MAVRIRLTSRRVPPLDQSPISSRSAARSPTSRRSAVSRCCVEGAASFQTETLPDSCHPPPFCEKHVRMDILLSGDSDQYGTSGRHEVARQYDRSELTSDITRTVCERWSPVHTPSLAP